MRGIGGVRGEMNGERSRVRGGEVWGEVKEGEMFGGSGQGRAEDVWGRE